MGLELRHLNNNRGVFATASGDLTGQEFVDAIWRVNASAAKSKPIFYTYFDFGEVTSISLSIRDLAGAAESAIAAANAQETERIVAVVAAQETAFRLATIYTVFIQQAGWEVRTFRDRNEAVAWLRSRAEAKHGIKVEIG